MRAIALGARPGPRRGKAGTGLPRNGHDDLQRTTDGLTCASMGNEIAPSPVPESGIGRMLVNVAWLLGGKGFGAVCSLVYLAILSRSLGLKDFGHFSLIFGTGQALVAIAGFQTWQAVVRYGATHIHEGNESKFGRLVMLCGAIEWIGALTGCLVAFVVFYGFASALDLNPAYVNMAFAFNCALLWARVSAPTGVLRAVDRFDLSVYVEAVVPTGRLIAATAIWLTGPTIGRFLFAWAAIDLLSAVLYWLTARRASPASLRLRYLAQWRTALAENPGAARFIGIVYAGSALTAVYQQGPLLAVGYWLGTSAAGVYRLADQLMQGFGKLSVLVTRAVYPEITRARVAQAHSEFRRLVLRVSLMTGVAGVVVVAFAALLGEQLLTLVGGAEFQRGAVVLVPLAIAASFGLGSVAYEPLLHSTGHARYGLFARFLTILVTFGGIFALAGYGPVGIAWAVTAGGAVGYVAMGLFGWGSLRFVAREERHSRAMEAAE